MESRNGLIALAIVCGTIVAVCWLVGTFKISLF